MLAQLTISNFAIVRELEIDFQNGMTVITGETGAGKSIAIDALGLCLGGRADADMVRAGATRPGCDGVTCGKPDRRQRLLGAKKSSIRLVSNCSC